MSNDRQNQNPQSRAQRIAVLGGGISGLAAAYRLAELSRESGTSVDVTLFDSAVKPGGVISTQRIGDYQVELGPDSFVTNKPWAVDLCRRLGLEDQLIETDPTYRRSLVLRNGKPVEVPEGFMLLSPAKVWPVIRSPIFSLWGKLRMGLEYFLPRKSENGDESLASFVRRRFGSEPLERLVQPLVGGIYTSDPEKLSLKATMPRFLEMEQESGSLIRASRRMAVKQTAAERSDSGARYSLFLTLAGGLSQLVETLAARVTEFATVRLNTTVKSLEPPTTDRAGWKVVDDGGSAETFDSVIVALPAHHSARLVRPFDAQLADALSGIEYASAAVVVSGHRLADIANPLNAFGLVVPAIEKRQVLAVSFSSRKFPGRAPEGRVLLRTFVGGAMQPELMQKSDDELIEITRRELSEILDIHGRENFAVVTRYNQAMPQYHVGHLERVDKIHELAAAHSGLILAGNAYQGVGIPDCIHSGEQAAERLLPAG